MERRQQRLEFARGVGLALPEVAAPQSRTRFVADVHVGSSSNVVPVAAALSAPLFRSVGAFKEAAAAMHRVTECSNDFVDNLRAEHELRKSYRHATQGVRR
jgi:hypothetical protein